MNTHIKVVGWLWIANGVLSIFLAIPGLVAINWPGVITEPWVSIVATSGVVCIFVPGIIADFFAGYGLLNYRSYGRILAIILAIINIVFLCYLILPAALAIYTLIIMFNEEVKALFDGGGAPPEAEEFS